MAGRDLKSIVDRIIDLPTLPQVVTRIMSLLEDPSSSAKDINDVMCQDPALVAKILKVVNSAFYGLPNRVSSISQAVVILGFNTVKSLAVSASVLDMFGEGDEDFSYEQFWAHAVGCATLSEAIAREQPEAQPETAFVLGLIHDLGKLVLDQFAPAEFREILALAKEQETSFYEAEVQVLETSHADIGFWLAQKWQLADDLAEAIHHQHSIEEAPDASSRQLASICSFADYVCRLKRYGAAGNYGKPVLPVKAWEQLTYAQEDLPALNERLNAELHRADAFLAVLQD
jgi:HD-like signal output (HDOD) protein